MEQSIEIAKEKSYDMRILSQEMLIADYNLKATTSKLKTHISMDLELPNYKESIVSKSDSADVFYSLKKLSYQGVLLINQPLPTDGRVYSETRLFTYKDYYEVSRSSNLNTRIGLYQPLNILYGYSQIRTDLKNARLNYESASKRYKREELALITDVTNSYYRLLSFQKQTEIALLNMERQTEAFEISKNKYEAGLIREVDALQMEVDLADAQSGYDLVVFNQYSAINSFKEKIGINLEDSIVLDNQMNYKLVQVNPEEAVQRALQNRLELRENDIQIEKSKMAVKRQKVNGLPQGSIDAYYEQTGVNMSKTNLDIAKSIRNSYRDFLDAGPSFGVVFNVSIPILDFGENRALVRAAEAALKNLEYEKEKNLRSIETNVRNMAVEISSNLKRLQLLEKNVSVAEKSFDITLQRFSDGDIDSQALALERNRLNNAYLSHLSAYIDYQMSLSRLMQATLY
ncbi:MAG: TolC family protein, partial [Bacteroidales bacterium]|nr:TolC family protein [Bacteroidales bacterium]